MTNDPMTRTNDQDPVQDRAVPRTELATYLYVIKRRRLRQRLPSPLSLAARGPAQVRW